MIDEITTNFFLSYLFYLILGFIFHFTLSKTKLNGNEFKLSSISLFISSCIHACYFKYYKYNEFHWLQIPSYLIIMDFFYYFLHRFMHLPLVYQWVHSQHHQFKPPSSWSASSLGIIETVLTMSIASFGPTYFYSFHPYVVHYVGLFLLVNSIFVHTNSGIDYPFLISPLEHYKHHLYGLQNRNFGLFTNIWDILFGTN